LISFIGAGVVVVVDGVGGDEVDDVVVGAFSVDCCGKSSNV
jgi:hypothetical protein